MILRFTFLPPVVRYRVVAGLACLMAAFGVGCGTDAAGRVDAGLIGAPSPAPSSHAVTISGVTHGGQQPISGATIQLYTAGQPVAPTSGAATGGLGLGAVPLVPAGSGTVGSTNNYWPATSSHASTGATCNWTTGNTNQCSTLPQTSSNGIFNITLDYTCPSANSQVYLVATGGNPTGSGTVNNLYIALMAALGSCGSLTSSSYVFVNEVTTVGAVWALQQFLGAPSGSPASAYTSQGGTTAGVPVNIGASSGPVGGYGPDKVQSQEVGLVNAFTMVNNLVNTTTGLAGPASSGVTAYNAKINAIANTLAACVNTDPSKSSICGTLMTDSTVSGVPAPTDTIQAAYMMARNPASNPATLLALGSSSGPFQPSLASTTANLDLTLEVAFAPTYGAASGFSGGYAAFDAQQIAIDENGRAWVVNQSGSGNGGLLTTPYISGIGVDGQVFAGPFQSFSISGGFGATVAGLPCPNTTQTLASAGYQIAIDPSGELWIPNTNDAPTSCDGANARTILRVNTATAAADTGYWGAGNFGALAVDGSGNVWFAGSSTQVQEFQGGQPGALTQTSASLGSGSPSAAAVDGLGNLWMAQQKTCTVGSTAAAAGVLFEVVQSGANPLPVIANGFYGTGDTLCTGGTATTVAEPGNIAGLAADANAGVWAVTDTPSGVSGIGYFAPQSNAWTAAVNSNTAIPLSGAQTVTTGNLNNPVSVAVDGSNHAWVVGNATNTGASGDSLAEYSVTVSSGTGNISSIGALQDYVFASTSSPFPHSAHSVAIDPSGNLWIVNGSTSASYVTVVVGLATPVVTPLALQAEYNLVGAMTTPVLASTSTALAYGSVAIGATATQSATLTNSGDSALSVVPSFSGSDVADFRLTSNTCGSSVAPLGSCTLTVTFAPLGTGFRTANLAIATSGTQSPLSITLSGTGTAGTAPAAPVFSPVAGSYSNVEIITVSDGAYGSTIYYTTDGTTPSVSSSVYTHPFQLNASATVKVLVVAPNYTSNTSASAMYTINTSGATVLATASVSPTGTKTVVGASFLGLSTMLSEVPKFAGTSSGTIATSTVNPLYVQMVSNLAQYSNGPFTLRVLNDKPFSVLPVGAAATLSTMGAFYNSMNKADTPHGVQFFVGVNLATDFSSLDQGCGSAVGSITVYADCGSASDAQLTASTLPSGSLIGFELGNEPDANGYIASSQLNGVPWSYQNFIAAYDAIVPGIQAAVASIPAGSSALPAGNNGAIMAGPVSDSLTGGFGTPGFISSESSSLTMFDVHNYGGGCYNATDPSTWVSQDYLMTSNAILDALASEITQAHTTQNAAGKDLTFRIGEINSICGGGQPAVSDRFQSALWLLDISMTYAQEGVDGLNFFGDGCPGIGHYTPFCSNSTGSYPNLTYSLGYVGPEYYGMLMVQQLLQNKAALVPITLGVNSSNYSVSAYATVDSNGTVRVLLINKTEGQGGDIPVTLAGHGAAALTYLQATGNNYLASDYTSTSGGVTTNSASPTDEITIGGQTFKGSTDGTLQGTQELVTVNPVGGVYTISMPQASAVLVTIP